METEPDRERLAREIEDMDDEWFGFRVHLGIYLVFNAVLAFVDVHVTGGADWFYWPLAGWGSGVLVHYLGLRRHERTLRRRAERAGLSLAHVDGRSRGPRGQSASSSSPCSMTRSSATSSSGSR